LRLIWTISSTEAGMDEFSGGGLSAAWAARRKPQEWIAAGKGTSMVMPVRWILCAALTSYAKKQDSPRAGTKSLSSCGARDAGKF